MTLTRRLLLGFAILAVLLLSVPTLLVGTFLQQHFLELARRETLEIAKEVDGRVRSLENGSLALGDPRLLADLKDFLTRYLMLKEGFQLESGFFIQIRDPGGRLVFATPNLDGQSIPVPPAGPPSQGALAAHAHGQIPVMLYQLPLRLDGQPIGQLLIAVSLVESRYILSRLGGFWLIGCALALAAAVLFALLLAREILKPLVQLTREVEALMQKDPQAGELRSLETSHLPPDQIRRLAQTFDTLLARLTDLLERQQRFVSDASHELRSPLTAIQGHAELLLKRGRSNPEILEEGLEIIRRESTRLGKLVEDLLLLAQLRHRKPRAEVFNLASAARQVVESRQLLHENLSYRGIQSALMTGDQNAIRRIVLNLIDNALRFTPSDAPIEVEVGHRGEHCCLLVRDHGSGIPAASLPHIFDRFYRIEADRNRQQGGAGLGLPIVKELVEWHQGQLTVESSETAGATFTILFPAAGSQPLRSQPPDA